MKELICEKKMFNPKTQTGPLSGHLTPGAYILTLFNDQVLFHKEKPGCAVWVYCKLCELPRPSHPVSKPLQALTPLGLLFVTDYLLDKAQLHFIQTLVHLVYTFFSVAQSLQFFHLVSL